jgi:hypothetical protein
MMDCKIENYVLARALAAGVRSDLFMFGSIPGVPALLLMSLVAFIDGGSREFWHVLPWIITISLLIGIFFGAVMSDIAVRNQLERIAKAKQCDHELTIWFERSLKD